MVSAQTSGSLSLSYRFTNRSDNTSLLCNFALFHARPCIEIAISCWCRITIFVHIVVVKNGCFFVNERKSKLNENGYCFFYRNFSFIEPKAVTIEYAKIELQPQLLAHNVIGKIELNTLFALPINNSRFVFLFMKLTATIVPRNFYITSSY